MATMKERRAAARARAAEDPATIPHGTASGYDLYGCRCEACMIPRRVRRRRYTKGDAGRHTTSRLNSERHRRLQDESPKDRRRRLWTTAEIDYLIANEGSLTVDQMAEKLGRTFFATAKKLQRLKDHSLSA